MRVAIIDLGTNTFNLLVVNIFEGQTQAVYHAKMPVKLGEGGFGEGKLLPEAMKRGEHAFASLVQKARDWGAEHVVGFATSAVRSAANGAAFGQMLLDATGIQIEIISGSREAELIYKGVQTTGVLTSHLSLIMDIGGGSTEFIIADQHQILWMESYPLGVARILEKIGKSDPITPAFRMLMEEVLDGQLGDLFEQVKRHQVQVLVGSSGSFDSFVDMLSDHPDTFPSERSPYSLISGDALSKLHHKLMQSTRPEREKMPGLIDLRVDFIVYASIFVQYILKRTGIPTIYQSAHSLKEGVLAELIASNPSWQKS